MILTGPKPSALLERYRMALEVIASGPDFEPGTKIAKLALKFDQPPRLLVPAPEQLRLPEEPGSIVPVPVPVPEDDDEPEPIDLDEIDAELDAEEAQEEAQEPASEPRRRQREPRNADGLTVSQVRIVELLRAEGELSPGEIRERLELPDHRWKRGSRELLDRGLVEAEGELGDRRFRAVVQVKPTMPDKEPASEPVADAGEKRGMGRGRQSETEEIKRNGVGTVEGRVLEAVGFQPMSIKGLAKRLCAPVDDVALAIQKLDREGEVKSKVKDGVITWRAV